LPDGIFANHKSQFYILHIKRPCYGKFWYISRYLVYILEGYFVVIWLYLVRLVCNWYVVPRKIWLPCLLVVSEKLFHHSISCKT
jgi:hypothetical protein